MQVILTTDEQPYLNWANQFVAADTAGRARMVFRHSDASSALALTLIEEAARQAGESGRVIISVGHGAVSATGAAAWVDLAPSAAFRLEQALITDLNQQEGDATLIQNTVAMAGSTPVVDFCHQVLGGSQSAAPLGLDPEVVTARCGGYAEAEERTARRRDYARIGEILRQYRVAEVMFLTCRVGTASDFMTRIAGDWRVSVLAYRERIVTDPNGEHGRSRVFREGHEPPQGTEASRRSETELPTNYATAAPP